MGSVNTKTAITLFGLAIVLVAVSLPLYLGKIKQNNFYGFRIRKAFESEENWFLINRFGAKALMWWSAVIVAAGIACFYSAPQYVLLIANVTFLSLLVPIVITIFYARTL